MADKQKILDSLFTGREDLPSLPTIFGQFNVMINSPSVSPRKVAALIKQDQSMVAKVIKLCNAALHGKRENISDISNAVAYLGLAKMKRMILQISLSRMFTFGPSQIPDFEPITFWEHSLGTAYFAEMLSKSLKLPPSEDFYLAGLMHDLGKKMLYRVYPDSFEEVVFDQINDLITDIEAEQEVLGVDHTDIGAFFAEKWKFSQPIIHAVKHHHSIEETEARGNEVTLVVHLANLFAKTADLCFPWEDRSINITTSPAWEKILSVSGAQVDPDKLTLQLFDATPEIRMTVTSLLSDK
ncbi:MAG: HDOD domain-containing protein [bacterium]|nr:HDOD domain-containing protein [bacterium]